jgi:hypothetical protein
MRINLLSHDNGVGLTQDVKIVKSILKGHRCTFYDLRYAEPVKADLNIHFEHIGNHWAKFAKTNLFFPNPEWFEWPQMLKDIDLTLCKTKDCQRIFDAIGLSPTVYTSFTSEDRNTGQREEKRVYLHTAGQSETKGTFTVFNAWKKSYPDLILTKLRNHRMFNRKQDNIFTVFERINLEVLQELQNKCTFHVCPSEYEGFGHYIWEAKSCGGIVITTGTAPMSEMVTEEDGFLVTPSGRSRRYNYGRLHYIEEKALQEVIEKTMTLTDKQVNQMRLKSRANWEKNDTFFKDTFTKIVNQYANIRSVVQNSEDVLRPSVGK